MNKELLFLETLNDLRQKIDSNQPYHLIKSSELIRSLLFDPSGSLVDKINRERRFKIKFEFIDGRDSLEGIRKIGISIDTFTLNDELYPPTTNPNRPDKKIGSKDNFLNALIIFHNNREYTVKDVLDFVLYNLGGTHHDDPKDEEKEILSHLNNVFQIGGHYSVVRPMKAIGLVVIDALSDLEKSIIGI